MRFLLISTYDLGRQPLGLASAAATLQAADAAATCVDLSRDRLPTDAVASADVIAFFLPMHTATRLVLPVIDRVRTINPKATLCAYGLYAPLNETTLRDRGVTYIFGGEFEDALADLARRPSPPPSPSAPALRRAQGRPEQRRRPAARTVARDPVPRVQFRIPLRESLPPLERYASLQWGSERRTAGYTEASRGCKHRCRHCPIVPVYDGRFRIVPREIVIEDVRRQIADGARHITFGDPDFFNGPRHALEVVRNVAAEFPGVSYDVTIKIEHLLNHANYVPVLRETGCAFVTSAVEAVDDEILRRLDKGHTAADFERAVGVCRNAGLVLTPTFVAFTPWTTVDGYCALLDTIVRLDLIENVAPIQLAIRLLIPEGSRLLELDDVRAIVTGFDPQSLTHKWIHADVRVDRLQESVGAIVGRRLNAPRRDLFKEIWRMAHDAAGRTATLPESIDRPARAAVPYLNEPWYC
jgi:radical SAM superfamily enzyme YgiQ (UPF0313 family)